MASDYQVLKFSLILKTYTHPPRGSICSGWGFLFGFVVVFFFKLECCASLTRCISPVTWILAVINLRCGCISFFRRWAVELKCWNIFVTSVLKTKPNAVREEKANEKCLEYFFIIILLIYYFSQCVNLVINFIQDVSEDNVSLDWYSWVANL